MANDACCREVKTWIIWVVHHAEQLVVNRRVVDLGLDARFTCLGQGIEGGNISCPTLLPPAGILFQNCSPSDT